MATLKEGKLFEKALEDSCEKLDIFYDRVKDVNLPPDVRMRVKLVPNKYDCKIFSKGHLFTLELKSTKDKSISFSESIIKQHQIDNLLKADTYEGVISGFLFNFREPENKVYFVPIKEFVAYKDVATNEIEDHKYKSKVNKSSIPFAICEEIGIEIKWRKKQKYYHYHVNEFVEQAIQQQQASKME